MDAVNYEEIFQALEERLLLLEKLHLELTALFVALRIAIGLPAEAPESTAEPESDQDSAPKSEDGSYL